MSYGKPTTLRICEDATLIIGNYCSISDGATFILGRGHDPRNITTYPLAHKVYGEPYAEDPVDGSIIVGNDVWLGRNCIVLPGVSIGDGSIIGAGAVISKNVEPFSVMLGNPAVCKYKRFNDEQIRALLQIRWWDWPKEKIVEYGRLLESPDIEAFLSAVLLDSSKP
jgi:acetyltransferase-like isoleucine patch superfamily enzyme